MTRPEEKETRNIMLRAKRYQQRKIIPAKSSTEGALTLKRDRLESSFETCVKRVEILFGTVFETVSDIVENVGQCLKQFETV